MSTQTVGRTKRRSPPPFSFLSFLLLLPVLTAGCATTGGTFRSGVGDAWLEHPPYYAGARVSGEEAAPRVGHLPVAYQRGATHAPVFDPELGTALQELLAEMTAYVDRLPLTARLVDGGSATAAGHEERLVPPDVQFGCELDPLGDCMERDDAQVLGREGQTMRLAVGRPSPEWTTWITDVLAANGRDYVLVLTLEVGQYLPRQRGWGGSKEVELGTDHVVDLPWLTSLETPVSVLQLTGALVGPGGRAIRIGAEGLVARRTALMVSALGAQELIGDEDVERLRTARRDDLPGAPLVWEAALDELVGRLVGA